MVIAVVVNMFDDDNIEIYDGYINYCKIYTVDNGKVVSKELVSLNFQCGKTGILVNKYKINYLICGSFPSEKLETRQPKDWHQYGVQAFYGAYGSADEAVELFLQTYYFTLPGVIKGINTVCHRWTSSPYDSMLSSSALTYSISAHHFYLLTF